MDKFDVLIETYGLPHLLDLSGVTEAQVLRELYDGGYFDPEEFEYDAMDVDADE